jgi:CTP:molybdopterin cytidylyltransferase MocA
LRQETDRRVAAVILAAGGSSRFGSPKQLLARHGENLVQRAARIAIEAGLDPVIVVLGAYASTIESSIAAIPKILIAVNEDWAAGQASSLRTGIERASTSQCDGALVLLADQPLVESSSLERLLEKFDDEHRIVASLYNEILGAPAIFGHEHFDALSKLEGDHGAGSWIRKHREEVTSVQMDEARLDIDTEDDLKHLPHE